MSLVLGRKIGSASTYRESSSVQEQLPRQDEWEEAEKYDNDDDDDDDEETEESERGGPEDAASEILRGAEEKLCLIKLCWPRVDLTKDVFLSTLPESYSAASGKERLLLLYAENFRRQFHAVYPARRPLLLACRNECGVQKFVSTTIKRSTLPYPELYTWQGCARFVSDYVEYEPPDEEALATPKRLRSPTWVTYFQKGNSFECSTFLVSLLRGQRYNAFVVSGYASREQVKRDLTRINCPNVPTPVPVAPPVSKVVTSKYKLKPPPDFRSQFLLELEEEKNRKIEAEMKRQEDERQRLIAELEKPPPDKYAGQRIHAWVVLLPDKEGPRENEISEPIFIETTTGVSYSLSDENTNALYFGIESVWNDRNYWVNAQTSVNKCTDLKWDLTNAVFWEHLLPGESPTMQAFGETVVDEEVLIEQEKHLDMPSSYVNEINIDSLSYERRYPGGSKTILYKKVKLELYAPYVQADGLIERIVVYNDYDYTMPVRIYEKYANRTDNLVESKRNFDTDYVTDSYKRGRPDACKAHRFHFSENHFVYSERTLEFYDTVRLDGLSRIEMHPSSMTQEYVGREDRLYERYTRFSSEKTGPTREDIHSRPIWNIVEKYSRDKSLPASKDIAIREYAMTENLIHLTYHYEEDRCTRASRTFVKPALADRGSLLVFNPDMTYGYNPNPLALPEKSLDLFEELNKQLREEDRCISYVREGELEIANFLKTRANERLETTLTVSLFNEHRTTKPLAMDTLHAQVSETSETDILGHHLARLGNPPDISKEQAYILEQDCLAELKQLLVNRANNMYRKFEDCQQELEATQATLTSGNLLQEEKDALIAKVNELNSYLHALEVRLNRHRDVAAEKYRATVELLRQSKHLSAFHNYASTL